MIKNEGESGSNPYPGGHAEVTASLVSRPRNFVKERNISPVPFNPSVRSSRISDIKMRVHSLNQHNTNQLVQILCNAEQLEPIPDVSIEKRGTTYTILEENASPTLSKHLDPNMHPTLTISQGSSTKELPPNETIQ